MPPNSINRPGPVNIPPLSASFPPPRIRSCFAQHQCHKVNIKRYSPTKSTKSLQFDWKGTKQLSCLHSRSRYPRTHAIFDQDRQIAGGSEDAASTEELKICGENPVYTENNSTGKGKLQGAMALIIGTSVGAGILALLARTRNAQGTCVSCATRSSLSVNANDMEAPTDNGMDGSASPSSSPVKRRWLRNLMRGLFGCEKPWKVPWTSFTIFQVMFLWFCTFWLVGSWIIPFAAHYAGCSKDTLTYRGQALYSLITDIAEGTVGLGILHRCLARFQPLPRNWFPFSWRGQWYMDVLLGCLTFPVVNRLSQLNLELLPFPSPLTSSYEQSIMARDPIASVLYAIVVSVCCPIWEEVIFRGFLLPSLTRYLPIWASIFVSAVVFGLAHFNVQRILPLTFLGLVMGIMFVRSRNLLSSMLLHSLWNGFVFMGLLR